MRSLLAEILRARVGGTFWAPPAASADSVEALLRPRTAAEARAMADAALADLTPANVLALLPDAAWAPGARRLLAKRGIAAEIGDVDPWPLLATASRLHAAGDDELAFLALLAGLRVHCVADGAIAGWGLTDDDPAIPSKGRLRLEQLAGTILIDQARYRDCYSGLPTEVETVVERLALWRSCIDANRPIAVGAGIAVWKRREIAAMLWAGRRQPLRFCQRAASAVAAASAAGGAIAVWPSRAPAGLAEVAAGAGVPLHRIEDGFVRSVGLGSALHPPLSVVVDSRGVHYDPTQPSDLETILAEAEFPIELTERAEALAAFIVGAGISKYSSGRGGSTPLPTGVRRVLVPGQVEDDLSVRLGGGDVQGNLDLLRRVRAQEPDAFLIFKPHPDVEAGHRPGHVPDAEALAVADRIVRDVPMAALLDDVDAIHVLTSLAGFEALLRGVEVVTHGAPFYAGWGLTRDLAGPFPRRGRTLALPELVAAALILYPRYLDPVTRLPCPPEILLSRLSEQRIPAPTWLTRVRGVQGRLRRPMRWARSAA
ncbi:MAG: Capsule polysaccharide biosynthesis protein [Sphingomonas bacterium]|nr:Capsule polysaccharide biosynthesis protein [Sphingomonas bacterium]